MMGPRQVDQAALFYEFSLERHVPVTHMLRSTACCISRRNSGDARLLLPMWGNGRIEMMLGVVTNASKV